MSKAEAAAIQIGDQVRVNAVGLVYEGAVVAPGLVNGDFSIRVSVIIENTAGVPICAGTVRSAYYRFVSKK